MVVCFGELLLRMSPLLNGQWMHEASMPVYVGGAELNAATALSRWQVPVKYCTAIPDNYLSKEIVSDIAAKGIDVSAIFFSGDRIGIYYLPQGADLKNTGVIYDRAFSSFASLQPGMIDWDDVLRDCSWFHFSAISPALTAYTAALCKEAVEAAHAKGITISVDLNYRAKLWQYGETPHAIMPELVKYCKVIMGNMWAAESLLNIPAPLKESRGKTNGELAAAARDSMCELQKKYPAARNIAYTFRLDNDYWAMMKQEEEMVLSRQLKIGEVTDRVGSGDCFMAGLIYGIYHRHPMQEVINFAAAAAIGKLKERGDATRQTIEEVQQILNS